MRDRTYPDLNEFERNIRNLVFRIVTKAFGTKWLGKTVTEEMKNGLKASIQTRPKALRDERLIEEALYEMDIKELENYLFLPQCDVSCEQVVDIALSPENLKQMSKEQIEAELGAARPKSLWERQFADKVSINGLQGVPFMPHCRRRQRYRQRAKLHRWRGIFFRNTKLFSRYHE